MGYKPMKRTARISDAEREVLNLLWDRSPQTVSELIASLTPTRSWKTQTVYVLLRRLIEKGFVTVNRDVQPHQFSPTMTEEESLVKGSGKSFFSLVASFIESDSVTEEDIDALSELLESKRRELEERQ